MPQGWIIHLKDGKTFTEKDYYPHDLPQDEITSVERIVEKVDGSLQAVSILKSPVLTNFFVKTSASQDMSPFEGGGLTPPRIEERILGAFIPPQENPVRLELVVDPRTGTVKLRAVGVLIMRKDGL